MRATHCALPYSVLCVQKFVRDCFCSKQLPIRFPQREKPKELENAAGLLQAYYKKPPQSYLVPIEILFGELNPSIDPPGAS